MFRSLIRIGIISLLFFLTVRCGSAILVTNDYDKGVDFKKYKTFSFYHLKTTGEVSQVNADRLVNAIVLEMKGKGFVESSDNPDLLINAVTVLTEKEAVSVSSEYYGYGGYYRPYAYGYGYAYSTGYPVENTAAVNTYNYRDGTIMIDILEAKSEKLIWEGTGTAEINTKPSDPAKVIVYAVSKIMESFPPESKKSK
ncbi:DUF4136 domain-containing protein [Flavobacterium sp.]|jgi:hypothetical protein|uniref:DUF4136 domain-containing protein n=1 Tax=Flavobacterium sp. TaxID=239 RepID=UPI0037C16F1B